MKNRKSISMIFESAKKKTNNYFAIKKIKNIPRHKKFQTNILAKQIEGIDSASFIFMFKEIFIEEIYKFNSKIDAPKIIDCGANIGLSTIYFKKLYPNSIIHAFEPDKEIYKTLTKNIESFGFENVELNNFGLWDENTSISFVTDIADGGRINEKQGTASITVKKLSPFLSTRVDLLKIDIEGAEFRVLKECESLLSNVENIFVEYHSIIGEKQNLGELLQMLTGSGFRIYLDTPGLHSKNPFEYINTYSGMDLQVNVFGIRS